MPIPRYYRLSVSTGTNCPHDIYRLFCSDVIVIPSHFLPSVLAFSAANKLRKNLLTPVPRETQYISDCFRKLLYLKIDPREIRGVFLRSCWYRSMSSMNRPLFNGSPWWIYILRHLDRRIPVVNFRPYRVCVSTSPDGLEETDILRLTVCFRVISFPIQLVPSITISDDRSFPYVCTHTRENPNFFFTLCLVPATLRA
jgi:hypothetical protein